jgi:hypothetical protein
MMYYGLYRRDKLKEAGGPATWLVANPRPPHSLGSPSGLRKLGKLQRDAYGRAAGFHVRGVVPGTGYRGHNPGNQYGHHYLDQTRYSVGFLAHELLPGLSTRLIAPCTAPALVPLQLGTEAS